jgi:hypothetical protein
VPAVGAEAGVDVLAGECQRGRPVDRDPVVVVDVDQTAQAEMPGQRRGLGADALHQIAIRADREHAMVDHLRAVAQPQEALGQRHPNPVAESLPERPGGRLDARRVPELGMARCA